MSALRSFWQARTQREQRILQAGCGIVLAALLYAGAWRPMRADLARLEEQLPRLRAQATQVRQAAERAGALKAKPAANPIARTEVPTLLARSAAAHRLDGIVVRFEPASGRYKARFERVAFNAWVGWVDELHRVHRLGLVTSRIEALDAAGMVRADAEFTLAAERR